MCAHPKWPFITNPLRGHDEPYGITDQTPPAEPASVSFNFRRNINSMKAETAGAHRSAAQQRAPHRAGSGGPAPGERNRPSPGRWAARTQEDCLSQHLPKRSFVVSAVVGGHNSSDNEDLHSALHVYNPCPPPHPSNTRETNPVPAGGPRSSGAPVLHVPSPEQPLRRARK